MSHETYKEYYDRTGGVKKKYLVGSQTVDGHTHTVFVRDDTPLATSSGKNANGLHGHHQHVIHVDNEGLFCEPAGWPEHTHTIFVELPNSQ